MARPAKPYLRKQTQSWYCSIDGQQVNLGKDREAAHTKFHDLMANRESIKGQFQTLYELSQIYLDWCQENRKPGTYDSHKRYLKSFIEHVGKQLRIGQLRQHHLTKWLSGQTWCDTSKNDAVSIVQRAINWAIEEGYLLVSPIPKVKKPPRRRRDVFYTPDQFEQIRANAHECLRDFLDFLWWTGCRPQEARAIEQRHVNEDLVIFPADESKGERDCRVIVLVPEAQAILAKYAGNEGPILRNSRGNPWNKDGIKCALTRVSEKVGFRVIAYGLRHSFATNSLLRSVDPVSVSHLMGHRDTRMVSQVYSHVSTNLDYLRKQARAATKSPKKKTVAPKKKTS